MNLLKSILTLLFLVIFSSASAVTVGNLYQAEIPVVDPSQANSNHDLRAALRAVIVKLTGQRQVESVYGVKQILDKTNDYVAQYEYRQENQPAEMDGEEPVTEHKLWVRFDQKILDAALQDFAVPLWSQERPLTLVWLVIDDGTGLRRFANLDEDPELFKALNSIARQRGIKLTTALNDLTDAANLKPADVSGGFSDVIKQASDRYQPDVILTGVLQQTPEQGWSGKWTSYIADNEQSWSGIDEQLGPVLYSGIHGHSDSLANRYAQKQAYGSVSELQIAVTDVENFDDYIRSLSYLDSLNFITRVSVAKLEQGKVVFDLQIRGGRDSLNQSLTFGSVITPDGQTDNYRLLR